MIKTNLINYIVIITIIIISIQIPSRADVNSETDLNNVIEGALLTTQENIKCGQNQIKLFLKNGRVKCARRARVRHG